MNEQLPPKEYVQRALNAAEIADSCLDARIRAQFFELSEMWLESAEEAAGRLSREADPSAAS